jgi:YD repeat-containing protein
MESMGYQQASLLVDADGTRHAASGTVYSSTYSYFSGHTTDGTLIDYSSYSGSDQTSLSSGTAYYPNGTTVFYGAPGNGAIYPTTILDAQGNYITITYRNNQGPQIDTITDTLGRVVQFYYDSNNLLTAITAPGVSQAMDDSGNVSSNSSTRTLVRLHYKTLYLNYSFSLNTHVRSNPVQVLDAIYYPATNTGYWFGDADSYSSYGMIAKVRERRGMGSLRVR